MEKILIYIGDGFLVGLPARDVTSNELQASGYSMDEVLATGQYEIVPQDGGNETIPQPQQDI